MTLRLHPGPDNPLAEQINSVYAYGIRSADGSYTRLIPADELAALSSMPRPQAPEALIITPELRPRLLQPQQPR